jgi:hypothetical protein
VRASSLGYVFQDCDLYLSCVPVGSKVAQFISFTVDSVTRARAKIMRPFSFFRVSGFVFRQSSIIGSYFGFVDSVANRFSFGEMLEWKPRFDTPLGLTVRAQLEMGGMLG